MANAIDMGRGGLQLAPEVHDSADDRVVSLRRVVEAAKSGRAREAFGPDDWTHMADTIDRSMRASYLQTSFPLSYQTLGYRDDSRSFEAGSSYDVFGVQLAPEVALGADYPANAANDRGFTKTLKKYGWTWRLPWESWARDTADLGLLTAWPKSWGLSARYTMEFLFTSAYAANATYFAAGNGNYVEGAGTALSETSLKTGLATITAGMTGPAGDVVPYYGPVYLVVPPALRYTAQELVESDIWMGGNTKAAAKNSLKGAATVVVNPLLPVIDLVSGTTAWYLFTDPSWDRPAFRYGHLRGAAEPEIFVRESDARQLFGGGSDPFSGSLANDSIVFKLRFTFGVNAWDTNGAYMSKGAA